jgi:hypothetical protein
VNGAALTGESPIVKLCNAGAVPPTTALNAIALGVAVNMLLGAAAVITIVTGIDIGEFGAPGDVTITCPL